MGIGPRKGRVNGEPSRWNSTWMHHEHNTYAYRSIRHSFLELLFPSIRTFSRKTYAN